MNYKILAAIALLTFATTAAGCGDEQVCTLASCTDSLTLIFEDADGEPVGGFSGTVTVDETTYDVDCTGGASGTGDYKCGSRALVLSVTPASEISVDIQAEEDATLTYADSLSLDVSTVQPNGPDCPPTCKQATETVTLEPASS